MVVPFLTSASLRYIHAIRALWLVVQPCEWFSTLLVPFHLPQRHNAELQKVTGWQHLCKTKQLFALFSHSLNEYPKYITKAFILFLFDYEYSPLTSHGFVSVVSSMSTFFYLDIILYINIRLQTSKWQKKPLMFYFSYLGWNSKYSCAPGQSFSYCHGLHTVLRICGETNVGNSENQLRSEWGQDKLKCFSSLLQRFCWVFFVLFLFLFLDVYCFNL